MCVFAAECRIRAAGSPWTATGRLTEAGVGVRYGRTAENLTFVDNIAAGFVK
jgi:hypothetical protein